MINEIRTALVVISQEEKYGGYNHSIIEKFAIIARFIRK